VELLASGSCGAANLGGSRPFKAALPSFPNSGLPPELAALHDSNIGNKGCAARYYWPVAGKTLASPPLLSGLGKKPEVRRRATPPLPSPDSDGGGMLTGSQIQAPRAIPLTAWSGWGRYSWRQAGLFSRRWSICHTAASKGRPLPILAAPQLVYGNQETVLNPRSSAFIRC
jgi:hypothetical protein